MTSGRVLLYLIRSSLHSMRHSWRLQLLLSGTLVTAFFILGGNFILLQNLSAALTGSGRTVHLSAYLRASPNEVQRTAIRDTLCKAHHVKSCEWRTAQDALAQFLLANPDLREVVRSLDTNPFPPSLEIDFDPGLRDTEEIAAVAQKLRSDPLVESVDDGGEWLQKWIGLLRVADRLMWGVTGALMLALIFIVANTITLIIHARRDEVEILHLVGASDGMIRFPFLLEGSLHGFVGSALALGILHVVFAWVRQQFMLEWGTSLAFSMTFLSPANQALFVAGGVLLGLLGSGASAERFLRV